MGAFAAGTAFGTSPVLAAGRPFLIVRFAILAASEGGIATPAAGLIAGGPPPIGGLEPSAAPADDGVA